MAKATPLSAPALAVALTLLLALHPGRTRAAHQPQPQSQNQGQSPARPPQILRYPKSASPEDTKWTHLALDRAGRRVYLGGHNRIVQLGAEELDRQAEVLTGPVADDPTCHASGCEEGHEAPLVDNVNKILVVVGEAGALIACGSVAQGACRKYRLADVSAESEFVAIPVAANTEDASTFAFVGPERYKTWGAAEVLYVGTTFTLRGEYRHDVPAVASRNLLTLEVAEYSFTKQSHVQIDVRYRDNFLVRYVYGFNASDYAYFVVVQKRSHLAGEEELGHNTRLARVCVKDDNYDSYAEVTLKCVGEDGRDYNLAADAELRVSPDGGDATLFVVFNPSAGIEDRPASDSAVCAYRIADVEAKFDENIHMCFNGSVASRNLGYVSGMISEGECPAAGATGNVVDFCDVGLKISGSLPLTASASILFPDDRVTAIATADAGGRPVLFLGTVDGRLKRVAVGSGLRGREYSETVLARGERILPDTTLAAGGRSVLALTDRAVYSVPVENCSAHHDCSACLDSADPYCGWCSLERRCAVREACQSGSTGSPRWLSRYSGHGCIDFEQVSPDRLPLGEPAGSVRLTIRTLPELPAWAKYRCVFGDAPPTDAVVVEGGLSCAAPPPSVRPSTPPGADHVVVKLSVRSSETNKDFVSRSFSFFNCSGHSSCSSCVSSKWACDWCVYDDRCVHDGSVCQRLVIGGENNPNRRLKQGPGHCPRIRRPPRPHLVPDGVPEELSLEAENLPRLLPGHAGYQCIVSIEAAKMIVPARVDGDRVVCDRTTYSYEAAVGETEATVRLVWNRDHAVDAVKITLYKCSVLGSHRDRPDCSLCVTRNSAYRCAWCSNSCSFARTCREKPAAECPRPRIDVIRPLSGPVEGGTLVSLEGSDLGLHRDEVLGKVKIGDVPCEIVDFQVSVKIVCRTGASNSSTSASVIVENDAGRTESSVQFSYEDVKVIGVHPGTGPVSGGTQLAIAGQHLNIGSKVFARLDDFPCEVNATQTSNGRLICVTSAAPSPRRITTLTVTVDNADRVIRGNIFDYVADPTIMEIKPLMSFVSGGRMITVHGTNLHVVQKPEMYVFADDSEEPINRTICTVLNPNQMECPSPAVNDKFAEIMKTPGKVGKGQIVTRIGFIMDNVQSMRSLEKHFHSLRSQMVYVEDPRVYTFPHDRIKSYKGDTLVIEGENLIRASDETDVSVTIGIRSCNLTSLTMHQLVCIPPEMQPADTDENGIPIKEINLPLVVIKIGKSLKFPLGYLKYEVMKNYNFPPEAIAGIAAGTFFLVLMFLIVLVVYRRRSTKAEREYKRIQIQMDNLESNVRMECKQAFAELQTDMSDLAADLENSGIPTLDHVNYVMNVFFPGVSDHPILNMQKPHNIPRTNYDAAMLQFEQLLNNKCFLLSFIDTLESQKSFNIRDKVNVASLLMVVLMSKMEYATDVLKCLLMRLIEKSICNKHPQLMLRRTESVVEKMLTNWMALCMYHYLKDYAGSSLFLLFKAIKHQIEKGLVDAITHEARYCLSEEKLLKEQIDHQSVTLHILQDDLDEKVQCRVLDCDTISQVKAKILDALCKNTPFSMRPSVHEVDLEWRHGRGGHLILQDEDVTTKSFNGWRKLNSLAHYGVKESAIVSLIPRQMESFNYKQSCRNCTGMYCSNSHIRIVNGDMDSDSNCHIYHLVKPMDYHHFANKLSEHTRKAIPEIFLTRLLSTKGTISKFVDDFFSTILTVNEILPPAVKWLFDLFDEAARLHGIANPEVVHAWKSNSLPLRFWVNLIKNPDFIFDINKTPTVDSCLSVVAQTFMDACSMTEHRLCKDSPSNKLLFAKDIPVYRDMVLQFYQAVSTLPQITDQEMSMSMQQLSSQQIDEFDTVSALKELYIYVTKYREQIMNALEIDPHCSKMHLAHKLETVACTLEGEPTSVC